MISEMLAVRNSAPVGTAKNISWIPVQHGKDGIDGFAIDDCPHPTGALREALRDRLTQNDLEGKRVGDVVNKYFAWGSYARQILKRYTIVHLPQQQGEMAEAHYSIWNQCGKCQFIPLEWNGSCKCYQQVNPTFDISYE